MVRQELRRIGVRVLLVLGLVQRRLGGDRRVRHRRCGGGPEPPAGGRQAGSTSPAGPVRASRPSPPSGFPTRRACPARPWSTRDRRARVVADDPAASPNAVIAESRAPRCLSCTCRRSSCSLPSPFVISRHVPNVSSTMSPNSASDRPGGHGGSVRVGTEAVMRSNGRCGRSPRAPRRSSRRPADDRNAVSSDGQAPNTIQLKDPRPPGLETVVSEAGPQPASGCRTANAFTTDDELGDG